MEKMFIFLKNRLICFLLLWILTIRSVTNSKPCPTAISKGTLSAGCKAVVGSICNFSCEVGYVRNTPASELTCQTSTEWNPDLRSLCLRPDGQQCPYVVPRGYLNLRCIREPGHTCNFACNEGYQPSLSPSIIACEIICPNLIEGGYIGNNCIREYKARCYEYECNPGYAKPDPASYVTCDESGKWVSPDGKSQACANNAIYSLTATTSTVPRNELSIVGIAVGCVIGTILITVSVGLIIQSLRTSRRRRLFRHTSSRCLGPTGYSERYVTSIVQNHNTNNTGVAASNEPYEHSFDSRTDIIANKYSRPPPSYSQTQIF